MSVKDALAAEQIVLGAMLGGDAVEIGPLVAEHFYDPKHQAIFEQVKARAAAGEQADGMALRMWADTALADLGGRNYLLTLLAAGAVMHREVVAAARDVRDASARRAAERELTAALDRVRGGDDVLEAVAACEAAMRDLGRFSEAVGVEVADAGDAMLACIDVAALSTGFASLDEKLGGLHRGDLIIVAGRPSMGKTALATQLARNAAYMGKAVHFASLEMPKEQLASRCMSARSFPREYGTQRVQYYHIRNGSNVDRALLRELRNELPRGLMIDDRAAQTLAQLEQAARATRRRLKRLDLIVVDYLQLMRALRSDGRVNEVGEISQGLKAIAKRLDVPVVALSQLSRGVEGRDNKRPTLSDLRDSGAIEQDADVVMGCYREAYYLERDEPPADRTGEWREWRKKLDGVHRDFELIVLKQRAGPIGTIQLEAHLEFDFIRDRRAA